MARISDRTWIFISHASADLKAVRKVRNYLEDKDASPLLFHLLSLRDEEEFWPIIEREILARDFFLYCESPAAEESPWVKRERNAVDAAVGKQVKRVASIRVDQEELDYSALDTFIGTTRVFPSYSRNDREVVRPFLVELARRGFEVFNELEMLKSGENWATALETEMIRAARYGWVVVFLSRLSMQSSWVQREINAAMSLGARFVPVLVDDGLAYSALPIPLRTYQIFDGTRDPATAPMRLADILHSRPAR